MFLHYNEAIIPSAFILQGSHTTIEMSFNTFVLNQKIYSTYTTNYYFLKKGLTVYADFALIFIL